MSRPVDLVYPWLAHPDRARKAMYERAGRRIARQYPAKRHFGYFDPVPMIETYRPTCSLSWPDQYHDL